MGPATFVCPAGAFLALAVLFFKDAGGGEDAPHNGSMVSNALQQLQTNRGLRAVLIIVGILLIVYGASKAGCHHHLSPLHLQGPLEPCCSQHWHADSGFSSKPTYLKF